MLYFGKTLRLSVVSVLVLVGVLIQERQLKIAVSLIVSGIVILCANHILDWVIRDALIRN
ncbi:hypothetical protein AOC36_09875 [Erysipelothrix larvae]|uniref:Uncharacterized protein n=1 Tax=Erysipelothrix larvae TaxID=1514105 RepID=A0A0X8H1A6_9FIRM|nr:hypothetical protein [Erysipelothrix larvae]AMC94272.1 hypothetical protein AOC36_09875 [Erysipelothrix larvae]